MAKEIELKLGIGKHESDVITLLHKALGKLPIQAEFSSSPLLNIYFDTPERMLNKHKMALRIRKTPQSFIQTLKTKGRSVNGLSERGEWEWPLAKPVLDAGVLQNLDVWPEGMDVSILQPVFETNFTRQKANIEWQGAVVELAFDLGEVSAGHKTAPINELELELKEGEPEVLHRLAAVLGEVLELQPVDISKAERGYSLSQAS